MTQIETLIPMVEFVMQTTNYPYGDPNNTANDRLCAIENYARFLSRPLELWMLVPRGEDGQPLRNPGICCGRCIDNVDECNSDERHVYNEAKSRCLLEGFQINKWENRQDEIDKTVVNNGVHIYWYNTTMKKWILSSGLKNIQDLAIFGLTLTPAAKKEIYGS